MSLSFMIFLYIIQSSAKSLIVDSKFFQISFTLPCGTPDVTLTSSDNCLTTLILCERQKEFPYPYDYPRIHSRGRNFHKQPIIRNSIESFEKLIIIVSILAPSLRESAMSWQACEFGFRTSIPVLINVGLRMTIYSSLRLTLVILL
jgi:hypothetical protein